MADEKTSRPDPLKRLRSKTCDACRHCELTSLADAWEAERRRNAQTIRELQSRLRTVMDENDGLKTAQAAHAEEMGQLQARLDASIPLPLDAAGYVWDGYEENFVDPLGKRHEIDNLGLAQGGWIINETRGTWYPAEGCLHVMEDLPRARKLHETIGDVRTYVRDTDWGVPDPYHKDPYGEVSSLVERAYACGKRDGGTR